MLDFEKARGGFVPMLTSCNPDHNPTYIDEGNNEMFVVEQLDDQGNVDQLHLTPNQAWEMRDKLTTFLENHFGEIQDIRVGDRKMIVVKRQKRENLKAA
jgi:hypothetical protein